MTLEELKNIALAATRGQWTWWTSNSVRRLTAAGGADGGVLHATSHPADWHADLVISPADMAHIAAASPANILPLIEELAHLRALVNSPELLNFSNGVILEAAHQVEKWGPAHDRNKSAEHWYWLVGYLAGKALRAAISGDKEKALHHTISSAAALANWHAAISADTTGTGIGADLDLQPEAA